VILAIRVILALGFGCSLGSCAPQIDTETSREISTQLVQADVTVPVASLNIEGWSIGDITWDSKGSVVNANMYNPICPSRDIEIKTNDTVFILVNGCKIPRIIRIDYEVVGIDQSSIAANTLNVGSLCFFKKETVPQSNVYEVLDCDKK
jgi:hypothetical protein